MKKLNLVTGVLLLIVGCNSNKKELNDLNHRDSFYSTIELGDYGVGFCDTVIYNSDVRFDFLPDNGTSYTQYDYNGPTPLFLQIWHPTELNDLEPMIFKDFRNRNLDLALQSVYDPLIAKMDSFFVRYNIIEDFTNYDSIDYGGYSYFEVLDTLMNYQTRSHIKGISDIQDKPVIVYHHGGQGLSDENLREHMAFTEDTTNWGIFELAENEYTGGLGPAITKSWGGRNFTSNQL